MIENKEKLESRKEYEAPLMEIMDCKVQGFLCGSGEPAGGDVCLGSENCGE